jgi:hypothetical protein
MMTKSIIKSKMQQVNSHPQRKTQGIHYTPPELARFLSAQVAMEYQRQRSGHPPTILDPAMGDGELVAALAAELRNRGIPAGRIYGFDTDANAVRKALDRLQRLGIPDNCIFLEQADFVQFALNYYKPSAQHELFNCSERLFDIVIANPPYVRTQIMGSARAQELARLFELSGRVDLYHAFILAIGRVLHAGGYAALIVSNRFMTTKSGADIRSGILKVFDILHVWDLGDTKLFEAAVLPALLLLKKKCTTAAPIAPFTAVYEDRTANTPHVCPSIFDALEHEGLVKIEAKGIYRVRQGILDHSGSMDGIWRVNTELDQERLQSITKNTALTFGDIGKIRVGVKTCADSVFIRRDWDNFPPHRRPELLWQLTTHKIARRFKPAVERDTAKILYPHAASGNKRFAVDLQLYPKSAAYLEQWREQLEKRHYLIESGRKWYEIWVPHDPALWKYPKLVFRDIASEPIFWIDTNGSIVNGDCYWLCPREDKTDLIWLAAAVGNSSLVEWFYDVMFNNKLYAGRRRFITQYVTNFPLPAPEREISQRIINLAKQAYVLIGSRDSIAVESEIDDLVWQAFGLSQEEIKG